MTNINLFFQEPNSFNPDQQTYSTLFLLRRDIMTSFGINPNNYSKIDYQVLFTGTMGIMAGIDLLSKFYYTDLDKQGNSSSNRFKNFVDKYIDNQNKEELYQLRNSLLHSFGLYSIDKNDIEYNFILTQDNNYFINQLDKKNYYISIIQLLEKFDNSIHNYRKDLIGNIGLQNNFKSMFQKYGFINIKK